MEKEWESDTSKINSWLDLPTLLNPPLDFNLQTDGWISSSSICFNYAKRYQLEWKIWNADQEANLIQAFYVKMETVGSIIIYGATVHVPLTPLRFRHRQDTRLVQFFYGTATWIWACKEYALISISSSLSQYDFVWTTIKRTNSILSCY